MIDVVVLAAGASSRFGADKLLADVDGRPLLAVTIDLVHAQRRSEVGRVVVVVPPDEHPRAEVAAAHGARVVESHHAARGMRWSIHAGLDELGPDREGAVVLLGDDPLAARALGAVLEAAADDPTRPVAVLRATPAPHPAYLPRHTWPAPPTRDDDTGLRALLDAMTCWIDGADQQSLDVDEPGDLVQLRTLLDA